jgi:hypothetical protein
VTPDLPISLVRFCSEEWAEEVERLAPRSAARVSAEGARRRIESGQARLAWRRCRSDGAADGTNLPGCLKLYVPLGEEGASGAPFGFVFRLQQERDGTLWLNMIAFGERHPTNPLTRSVYERAHKRLHGRYP